MSRVQSTSIYCLFPLLYTFFVVIQVIFIVGLPQSSKILFQKDFKTIVSLCVLINTLMGFTMRIIQNYTYVVFLINQVTTGNSKSLTNSFIQQMCGCQRVAYLSCILISQLILTYLIRLSHLVAYNVNKVLSA